MKSLFFRIFFLVVFSAISFNLSAITCSELDGAYVYSQDITPKYLGFFGSPYSYESIMNITGPYGSTWGIDSVRNTSGLYGSTWGMYSANNPNTFFPPKIYKYQVLIGYLTTNSSVALGVSLSAIDASCTFYSTAPADGPPPPVRPYPPSQVVATDGTIVGGVYLTWTSVGNATFYNVYVSDTLNSTKHFISSTSTTSMNLTGGTPGQVSYFWVFSGNAAGESVTGTYDTGYPASLPNVIFKDGFE